MSGPTFRVRQHGRATYERVPVPTTVRLTVEAVEDLERLYLGDGEHVGLERGGVLCGWQDGTAMVIHKIIRDSDVTPYHPDRTHIHSETIDLIGNNSAQPAQGIWHTHEHPLGHRNPSREDKEAWRSLSRGKGQIAVGMIVAPALDDSGAFPRADWDNPQVGAWIAGPNGELRQATVTREPASTRREDRHATQ